MLIIETSPRTREKSRRVLGSIQSQFLAQLSPYAQKMYCFLGPRENPKYDPFSHLYISLLEHVEGVSLEEWKQDKSVTYEDAYQKTEKILKKLAEYLADELRYGFCHHDLYFGNVIYSEEKNGEINLSIIDFGNISSDQVENDSNDLIRGFWRDYFQVKAQVVYLLLSRKKRSEVATQKVVEDTRKLVAYFDNEFEKVVANL